MPSPESGIVFRKGKRVFLGPIDASHAPLLATWINDPEVTQFLTSSYPLNVADEVKWIESLRNNGDNIVFGIFLIDSGRIIGNMGLNRINRIDGTAVTGSLIGEAQHQGQGFGTEAKMLLLEYAFNTLNLRKICSQVYDFNVRSRRCLEKCGYKPEGTLRAHVYRQGRYVDVHNMAVFKDDFLPLWEEYRAKHLS